MGPRSVIRGAERGRRSHRQHGGSTRAGRSPPFRGRPLGRRAPVVVSVPVLLAAVRRAIGCPATRRPKFCPSIGVASPKHQSALMGFASAKPLEPAKLIQQLAIDPTGIP